ncbi:ATPase family associated with various cellular activities (AAA) [Sarcina sp. DSM 11001]|uniref:ATP-binding protein n=1 Tax=Sarcina sp. DSM 11001 TaxID=1798184 RepID=UPI0008809D5D|nr:AAA family ATPase [Sarcina sp. DSM 11001]SDK96351.1 ATPase family associated with various cellular activities (AAA) [Sarcina sp. DSM 11001]
MNIKEAKEVIIHTVQAYLDKDETGVYTIPTEKQRPILLMGPPGIGKTAIMEQVAEECGIGLVSYTITHHTRQSAIGLPFISRKNYGGREYSVTEYTMSEIIAAVYDQIEASGVKEGILFLDEINCVSETLAPTMLQFLQYKTFGAHRVPDGFIIVTAGNPPQYNKSVRDFDIVTLDRLRRIDIEEDFASFREYASRAGIHGSIMAYLGIRNNHFYSIRTEVEGRHFVTARGWEDLSRTIQVHEKRNLPVNEGLAVQFLQDPEISRSFAVYYELYKKYGDIYRVPDILAGRFTGTEGGEKLELDPVRIREMKVAPFDEKLSLISLLIEALSQAFAACARDKAVQELLMREMSQVRQVLKSAENKSVENQSAENTGEGDSASSQGSAETKLPGSSGRQSAKEEQPGRAVQNIAAEAIHERSGSLLRELRRKKEAGIPVEREQERVLRTACREMDVLREQLLEKSISQPLPPRMQYALIRDWFSAREQARQTAVKEADTSLTNAFRFLSHVYGDGQEMVLFLTELSSGYYSLKFINEHGNEEYFRYNRMLLLRERRDALRDEVLRLME